MEVTKESLEQMTVEELQGLTKLIGEVISSRQAKELKTKPKFKRRKGCLWLTAGDKEIHLSI